MARTIGFYLLLAVFAAASTAAAQFMVVDMRAAGPGGPGASLGTITVTQTPYGVLFIPELRGLGPGLHGFHVHENPSCDPKEKDGQMVPALAAGGHYDPAKTGKHLGPYGEGHLGDLPPIYAEADGSASLPVLAPRLKLSDLKGRSLMIHKGGDNYSDMPEPLGGGGPRVGCGVMP
jgi:Cu-Zn family superoxide dismutase